MVFVITFRPIPFLEVHRMGVTPKGEFRVRMRIPGLLQVVKQTIHIDIYEVIDDEYLC